MAHGSVSSSIVLARRDITIQSTYTFAFASAFSPIPYTTPYTITANGTTALNLNQNYFTDASMYASSALSAAMTAVSGIANLGFTAASPSSADIVVAGINQPLYVLGTSTPVGGFSFYPQIGSSTSLDQHMYLAEPTWLSAIGGTIDSAVAHQLNHTIGLRDAADASIAGTADDSGRFTIMSYNVHPGTNARVSELQLYDIASIQSIYGADNSDASDTTYSSFADASGAARMYAIWDGGGSDTIDASGSSAPALIDLRPGYFSSLGPDSNVVVDTSGEAPTLTRAGILNISIAFGAYIENATGTAQSDLLIGNRLSNQLVGGDGNDVLFGDGENALYDPGIGDYRQISGTSPSHLAAAPTSVAALVADPHLQTDTLDGGDGNDLLYGGAGVDTLSGGDGNDFLWNMHSAISSTAGDGDTISGGSGDDVIVTDGGSLAGGDGQTSSGLTTRNPVTSGSPTPT